MKYIIPPRFRNVLYENRKLLLNIGLSFVITFVSATGVFARQGEVAWETDLGRAMAIAKESGRPLFLHFYGNNCPPCKAMDATVFTDAKVIAELGQHFVAVKLDTSKNPEWAKQFEITAIPTDILLDENDGRVISRRQGGIAADRFCQYLTYLQTNVIKQQLPQAPQPQLAVHSAPKNPPAPQPTIAAKPIASQVNETVLVDPFTKKPVLVSGANSSAQAAVASAPMPHPANVQETVSRPIPQAISQSAPAVAAMPAPVPAVFPANEPQANNSIASAPAPQLPDSVFAVSASTFDSPAQPIQPIQSTQPSFQAIERNNPVRTESIQANTQRVFEQTTTLVLPSDDCITTATQTVEVPLGLEGYCPVILGNEERWTPGNPALYVMFRGHVYRFSNEQAMATFIQNPMKFAPIAMGEDIVLMVERNKKSYGTRKFGAWYDGRVYLFSCQESLDIFAAKPEYYAEIAQKYETAFKSPMNTVQR